MSDLTITRSIVIERTIERVVEMAGARGPAGAAAVAIKNEGSVIEAVAQSIDFVGAGVSAATDGSGNITVTVTGGGGGSAGDGAIVEVTGYAAPTQLASSAQISAPTDQRSRRHIKGSGGAVTGVTIAQGTDTQELYLIGTNDTDTVQMVSSTNVLLSGTWVARDGSMLALQWIDGLDKWVEVSRNEI